LASLTIMLLRSFEVGFHSLSEPALNPKACLNCAWNDDSD
jgi:hypothetical protein